MELKETTALKKITKLIQENKKITIVQGGQGSSKTFSIITLLINRALSVKDQRIYVLSHELSKMKKTVIKDFISIMKSVGYFVESEWNKSENTYNFDNDSFINFVGCDKMDMGKGLRSDIAYFNEVDKIDYETYEEVASRAKKVIVDYNPDYKFWIYDTIMTEKNKNNYSFGILTFEDNEHLDKSERDTILSYKENAFDENGNIISEYFHNKWITRGLGILGKPSNIIFNNWNIGTYDENFISDLTGFGLDFGVKDKDAMVEVKIDKRNNKIYVREKIYQNGLSTNELSNLIKSNVPNKSFIVADSQANRTIIDLNKILNPNLDILPVQKNKIIEDIKLLQDYEIIIDRNSSNFLDEISKYKWLDKKTETPTDKDNHLLDAFRYICQTLLTGFKENNKKRKMMIL